MDRMDGNTRAEGLSVDRETMLDSSISLERGGDSTIARGKDAEQWIIGNL